MNPREQWRRAWRWRRMNPNSGSSTPLGKKTRTCMTNRRFGDALLRLLKGDV